MILQKIKLLIELTRWKEWISWLGFVLFGYFLSRPVPISFLTLFILSLVSILSFSFGFSINDYFDAPFDRLKPKIRNLISCRLIKESYAAIFCLFLFVSGLLISLLFLPFSSFIFFTALYGIFFIYSSPPFRMKEKSFLGIIIHGVSYPLLILASYLAVSSFSMKIILISASVFFVAVICGIMQEIRDINDDKKAGFRTTAIALGYDGSINLARISFFGAIIFFASAVILYMPIYLLLILISQGFYINLLLYPPKKDFAEKSFVAWNKAIVSMFVIGIILLPFYMDWIAI